MALISYSCIFNFSLNICTILQYSSCIFIHSCQSAYYLGACLYGSFFLLHRFKFTERGAVICSCRRGGRDPQYGISWPSVSRASKPVIAGSIFYITVTALCRHHHHYHHLFLLFWRLVTSLSFALLSCSDPRIGSRSNSFHQFEVSSGHFQRGR